MRFLWDWPLTIILLPLKLGIIWVGMAFQLLRNWRFPKNMTYWGNQTDSVSVQVLDEELTRLLKESPVFESENHLLYALRIPLGQAPDGQNHNTDHMAARQGVFLACLGILGGPTAKPANTLALCARGGELARGFKLGVPDRDCNWETTSGDMLIGMLLGFAETNEQRLNQVVANIAHKVEFHGGLTHEGKLSVSGNLRPGASWSENPIPVGAQDITYLAAMLAGNEAERRRGINDKTLIRAFRKRFYLYLGFLTILWPAFGWRLNQRHLHNEHVCLQATYICHKYASNRFERWIFRMAMKNLFRMSWPDLNGYFAGMTRRVCGDYPSADYLQRCAHYAMDLARRAPGERTYVHWNDRLVAYEWPVSPVYRNCGEFLGDEDHEYCYTGPVANRSTLGQIANLAFLRKYL